VPHEDTLSGLLARSPGQRSVASGMSDDGRLEDKGTDENAGAAWVLRPSSSNGGSKPLAEPLDSRGYSVTPSSGPQHNNQNGSNLVLGRSVRKTLSRVRKKVTGFSASEARASAALAAAEAAAAEAALAENEATQPSGENNSKSTISQPTLAVTADASVIEGSPVKSTVDNPTNAVDFALGFLWATRQNGTDLVLADFFFTKAASRGHAASLCARGFLCEHRQQSANPRGCDLREAGEMYAAAAANGCAVAGTRLAELLLSGAVDPPGYSVFLIDRWRRGSQANKQPLPQKLAALAALKDDGRVSNAEFLEAKQQLLREVGGSDNPNETTSNGRDSKRSENNVGSVGNSVTGAEEEEAEEDAWAAKRVKRAIALLRAASAGNSNSSNSNVDDTNQGDPVAMHRLAWLLLDGIAVDDEETFGPSETSASASSANSRSNEALQLLRQAAGLGHARAQYDLGVLIREGRASAAAAGQLAGPSRRRAGGAAVTIVGENESVDLLTGTSRGGNSTGSNEKAAERAVRAAARAARVAAMKQRASSDAAAVALWRKAALQGMPEAHYALFSLYAGQGEAWEGFTAAAAAAVAATLASNFKSDVANAPTSLPASAHATAATAAAVAADSLTPRRRDRSPRASSDGIGTAETPGSPGVRASSTAEERASAAPVLSSPGRAGAAGGSTHHHARTPPPPPLTKQEALAHLEAAATGGWPPACCDLAYLLLGETQRTPPCKPTSSNASAEVDAAAPATPSAPKDSAGWHALASGVGPDKARAVQLLAQAAHAGWAPAQLQLGQLLECGAHVIDTSPQSAEGKVVLNGDLDTRSNRSGVGSEEEVEDVEPNDDVLTWPVHAEPIKAAEWYRRAAAQGCPHSALALAQLLTKISRCSHGQFDNGKQQQEVQQEQEQQQQKPLFRRGIENEVLPYDRAFPHLPVHLRGSAAATAEACDVLAHSTAARALPGGSELLTSLWLERGRVDQASAVLAELVAAGMSARSSAGADLTEEDAIGTIDVSGATFEATAAAICASSDELQRRAEAAATTLKVLEARRVTLPPKPVRPPAQPLTEAPTRVLPPHAHDWPLNADPMEGALAGLSGNALLEATAALGAAEIIHIPPLPPTSYRDDDYLLGFNKLSSNGVYRGTDAEKSGTADESSAAPLVEDESPGLKKAPPKLCRYCTQHNFQPSEVFRNKPAERCKSCGSDTSKEADENEEEKMPSKVVTMASPSPVKGSRSPPLLCEYCTLHGFKVTAAFLKKSPTHCKSCGEDTAKEKKKRVENGKKAEAETALASASNNSGTTGDAAVSTTENEDALLEAASAERRKPADDFLCSVRDAILACEAAVSEYIPSPRRRAAVAAERAAAVSLDAKLEGSNDDNLAKEQRRLAVEWSVKLQRELTRKAKVLDALYARAHLAKLEKKRKQERSLRTVEGYDDAWFTTDHNSSIGGGGGVLPNSRSSNDLLGSIGGVAGSTMQRSSQSSEPDHRRRGSNNHYMLSAVARASRVMDNLIGGFGGGSVDWSNTHDRSRTEGHSSSAVQWASLLEFGDLQFAPGLQVWRAEQFGVVYDPVAADDGVLLRGNAYVVAELKLETWKSNSGSKSAGDDGAGNTSISEDEDDHDGETSGGLEVTLYYWVGSKAPLDAATVASFKSTELARRLRADMASTDPGALAAGCRKVTTRREAEGDESDNFLRAFQRHRARLTRLKEASNNHHHDGHFEGGDSTSAAVGAEIHEIDDNNEKVSSSREPNPLQPLSEQEIHPKLGLQYCDGGTASSLLAPPPKNDRPRLFRVCLFARDTHIPSTVHSTPVTASKKRRGGIEASLCEVERSEASLRPEWVTILDSGGDAIYVYRGFLSTTLHRAKAFEMSLLMRQERVAFLGACNLVQVNQGDEPDEFWALIPPPIDVDSLPHAANGSLQRKKLASAASVAEIAEEEVVSREIAMATSTVADTTSGNGDGDNADVADSLAPPPPPSPSQLSPNSSKRGILGQQQAAAWERNIEMALDEATNRVVSSLLQAASSKIVATFYSTASGSHSSVNFTKIGKNSSVVNEGCEGSTAATEPFDVEVVFTESDGAMGLAMRDVVFFLPAPTNTEQDQPSHECKINGNTVLDTDASMAAASAAALSSPVEESCVQIVSVDPRSAGAVAGVQPGDLVKALNGRTCSHLNRKAIAAQIRKAGRPMAMTLRRGFPLSQVDDLSDLRGASASNDPADSSNGANVAATSDTTEVTEIDQRDLIVNEEGDREDNGSKVQGKRSGHGLGQRLLNVQRLFGKRTKAGEESINERAIDSHAPVNGANESPPTAVPMNGNDESHAVGTNSSSAHGDVSNTKFVGGGEEITPPEKAILESSDDDDGSSGEDEVGYEGQHASSHDNGTAKTTQHAASSSEFEVGSEAPGKLLKVFLPVEGPVRLRPGEKVLVQRSTGTWVRGQVIEYMDERDEAARSSVLVNRTASAPSVGATAGNLTAADAASADDAAAAAAALQSTSRQRPPGFVGAALSVRVGVLKKKVLDLGKPRHLAQLRVKPGTVLLEVSSPPREVTPSVPATVPRTPAAAANTAVTVEMRGVQRIKRDLPLTPLPRAFVGQVLGNGNGEESSRRASDSKLPSSSTHGEGVHEQRRLTSGTSATTSNSSEDAVLALDSGVDQRRILYRVGMIGHQYNIAEVYSRHEDNSKGDAIMGTRPRGESPPARRNSSSAATSSSCSSSSSSSSNGGPAARVVSRTALKTNGVFVLDCSSEVYVWLGRAAPVGVRMAGISVAERLVSVDPLRPRWVTATQVPEGAEPFVFKTKFVDWLEANADAAAQAALRRRAAALRLTGETLAVTSQQAARQQAATKAAKANRSEESRAQESAHRRAAVDTTAKTMRAAYAYTSDAEAKELPPHLEVGTMATTPFSPRREAPGAAESACAAATGTDLPLTLAAELAADRGGGMTLMWRLTPTQLIPVAEHEYGHLDDRAVFVVLYGFVPSVTAAAAGGTTATGVLDGISGAGDEGSSDSGSGSDDSSEASGAGEFDEYLQDPVSDDDEEIDPMVALLAAVKRRGLKLNSQNDARARRRRRRHKRRAKQAAAAAADGNGGGDNSFKGDGPSSLASPAAAAAAAAASTSSSPAANDGGARFVLYVWCGDRAPRTLLARWRMEVSVPWRAGWKDELGCEPHELLVEPRREPPHFLRVFARLLVLHVHFSPSPATSTATVGCGGGGGGRGGARISEGDDAAVQAALPQMAQKSALGAAIVAAAGSASGTSTSMPSLPDSETESGKEASAVVLVERHLFHVRGRGAGAWLGLGNSEAEEDDDEEEKYVHAVEVPLPAPTSSGDKYTSGNNGNDNDSSNGSPQLLFCSTDVYLLLVQRPQPAELAPNSAASLSKPPTSDSVSGDEKVVDAADVVASSSTDVAGEEATVVEGASMEESLSSAEADDHTEAANAEPIPASSKDETTLKTCDDAAASAVAGESEEGVPADAAPVAEFSASELWVWVGLQSPGPLRSVGSDLAARLAERHKIDPHLIHVVLETPHAAAATALAVAAVTTAAATAANGTDVSSISKSSGCSTLTGSAPGGAAGSSSAADNSSRLVAAGALKPSLEEEAFWQAARLQSPWNVSDAGTGADSSAPLISKGVVGDDGADVQSNTGTTATTSDRAQSSRSSWLGWAKAMKKSRSKRAKKKALLNSSDIQTAPVPGASTISTAAANTTAGSEAAPAAPLPGTNNNSVWALIPESARIAALSVGWALCPSSAPVAFRLEVSDNTPRSYDEKASKMEQRDVLSKDEFQVNEDNSSVLETVAARRADVPVIEDGSSASETVAAGTASPGCFHVELLGQHWTQHDLTPEAIIVFDCGPGVSSFTEASSEDSAASKGSHEVRPVLVWMGAKVAEQKRLRRNARACALAYVNTMSSAELPVTATSARTTNDTNTTGADLAEMPPLSDEPSSSSSSSRTKGAEKTMDGSHTSASQRPVWFVRQYNEPPLFQALFHGWCPWPRFEKEAFRDPRDARLKLLQAQQRQSKTASADGGGSGSAGGHAGADAWSSNHLGRVLDATTSSLPPLPEVRSTSKKHAGSWKVPRKYRESSFTTFSSSSSESSDEDVSEEANKAQKEEDHQKDEDDEEESSMAAALLVEAAGLQVHGKHAVGPMNNTSTAMNENKKGKKGNSTSGSSSASASFFNSFVSRSKPVKAPANSQTAALPLLPPAPSSPAAPTTATTPPRNKAAPAQAISPAGMQARAVGPVVRISGGSRHSSHSISSSSSSSSHASPNRRNATASAAPVVLSPPQVALASAVIESPSTAAGGKTSTEAGLEATAASTANANRSVAESTTAVAAPTSPFPPHVQQPAESHLPPPPRPPQVAPNSASAGAVPSTTANTTTTLITAAPEQPCVPAAPLLSDALPPTTRPAPSVRVANAGAGTAAAAENGRGKATAKKKTAKAGGPKKKPDRSV